VGRWLVGKKKPSFCSRRRGPGHIPLGHMRVYFLLLGFYKKGKAKEKKERVGNLDSIFLLFSFISGFLRIFDGFFCPTNNYDFRALFTGFDSFFLFITISMEDGTFLLYIRFLSPFTFLSHPTPFLVYVFG
jgi:hypothetical protein